MADTQFMFEPTVAQILAAVESLCADELKPLGRVVLKRLREHAAAEEALACGEPTDSVDPESMPRIDPKVLRRICEESDSLWVTPEEGKEYSAVPVGHVVNFVDVCDPCDPFDSGLWLAFASHLETLAVHGSSLPCGRYACARALVSQDLPFLTGLSFGRVCHVVQLAISQKRLLGHRDGRLVPYTVSDEYAKAQCAQRQQAFSAKRADPGLSVATWESTRACLQQLLLACPEKKDAEAGTLPLSDVKRLFRRQFDLELNEAALGYTRVFDLLQDPRLRDVCTVHAQGNGQVTVRRVEPVLFWPASHTAAPRLPCLPGRLEASERAPLAMPVPLLQAVSPPRVPTDVVCLSTCPMPCIPPSFGPTSSAASNRCLKLPAMSRLDEGMHACELISPGASPRGMVMHGAESDVASTFADSCVSEGATSDEEEDDQPAPGRRAVTDNFSTMTPESSFFIVKNTFFEIAPGSTCGSARRRTQSEPRSV